jgi:hypothetical protein
MFWLALNLLHMALLHRLVLNLMASACADPRSACLMFWLVLNLLHLALC